MKAVITHARSTVPALIALLLAMVAVLVVPAPPRVAADEVPRVLVYSATQAYRHGSIAYGNPIIAQLAQETGAFTVAFTEDPAAIVPSVLADYDLVLFNSPSGVRWNRVTDSAGACAGGPAGYYACDHAPFTQAQRDGFIDWLGCGGGIVGVHQAMDAWHDWPEWDEIAGMIFSSHYSNAEAELFVLSDHPAAAPFGQVEFPGDPVIGDRFVNADEYYDYAPGNGPLDLSSDVVPLVGIGAFTNPSVEASQGGHYDDRQPMAWLSSFRGDNRVFMTNLGHNTTTWDKPEYRAHLVAGIAHVAGQRPDADCVAEIDDPPFVWPNGVYVYGM